MSELILFVLLQGFLLVAPPLGCFALGWMVRDAVTKRKANQ